MKQKVYKHGSESFKTYFKAAGTGYEVCLKQGSKLIFASNFIHKTEASKWYQLMNKEIQTFGKKFWVEPGHPKQWYGNFLANHLYQCYYKFVGKVLDQHHKSFNKACDKDMKKYKQLKKQWTPKHQVPFKKAA